MVEGGWPALGAEPDFGGQGLPAVVNTAYSEMSSAANMAFSMYAGLTHGAYSAIHAGGSDAQKATYLPKLATGQWGGTMNLTEPQCGTDLGLLTTKAVPQGDGTYRISGQKIWISGGEHDLAENIVHLVLARIEGAPAGVRGISLFITPKFLPTADGGVGARNEGVKCAGLEEKMGIHGNATCVMVYEDAKAWLIGEENAGLRLMFVMMNEERLGVGVQGLAQGDAAYQAACDFARERLQSRSLSGPKNPDGPADPIIVHPDVRRMLMDSRAVLEGGRAFLYWTALHGDLMHGSPDEAVKERASDYMGLLNPGREGVHDRPRLPRLLRRHAGARRLRLHRALPRQPVPARLPHQHDLRGHQRHPGPGPRRPQAGREWRPRGDELLRRGRRLRRPSARRRPSSPPSSPA